MNINDHVWVKLTQLGRDMHRNDHEQFLRRCPQVKLAYAAPTETDGWSRWQLWNLMHLFGPFCYMGAELPFATEILLAAPDGEGNV